MAIATAPTIIAAAAMTATGDVRVEAHAHARLAAQAGCEYNSSMGKTGLLGSLLCVAVGCGRAHGELAATGGSGGEAARTDDDAAGAGGDAASAGRTSQAGDSRGNAGDGAGGDGASGSLAAGSAAAGSGAAASGGDAEAGTGAAGMAGTGLEAGASGVAGGLPPGTGGEVPPPGRAGSGGGASQVLNPFDCDTPLPFVLSIDPSGDSGHVSGWLESTASVVFVNQLPRFAPNGPSLDTPAGSIALWWSIAGFDESTGEGELYLYGGGFTSSVTELVVLDGAASFADVDRDALQFSMETTRAVGAGTIVVFRKTDTLETMALRVDGVLAADGELDSGLSGTCVAVEASWTFAL